MVHKERGGHNQEQGLFTHTDRRKAVGRHWQMGKCSTESLRKF